MIVARRKPLREIYQTVRGYGRVLILGCNTCVAVCHAGGSKEAEVLASLLRILAIQEGRNMEVAHTGASRQCEEGEEFQSLLEAADWADALVSTACGAGVQFVAERRPDKPVYPGVDTVILGGVTESPGLWTERCQGCGECVLARTGGICPVSRCAKRLLNGPCGGSSQGKCEISPELDCAWQLIVDRLKALGRMDLFEEPAPLKDWASGRAGGPGRVIKREDESGEKSANE
jgi:ferredoxin